MKYAVFAPTIHEYSDPRVLVQLARSAERAGWDGLFLWDHLVLDPKGDLPIADATVAMAAIAAVTERLVFGPMVTPISRRRPWKVAKELAALDLLSNGRVRFGVGLGGLDQEFASFGENPDKKVLAARTDEGLAVLDQLLRGAPALFEGEHYRLSGIKLLPAAVQRPRIPIWVAAMLPFKAGQRRAARWDGLLAQKIPENLTADTTNLRWHDMCLSPEELRGAVEYAKSLRASQTPFDVIAYGSTFDDRANGPRTVQAYADAGATWWCEWLHSEPGSAARMEDFILAGPPRPS